jgi:hypothetical protein
MFSDIDDVLKFLRLSERSELAACHRMQDLQSWLMHREAVQLVRADPALATKAEATLERWMSSVDPYSRPLLERWAAIIAAKDWDAVLANSGEAQQLRQASPFAGVLPEDTRLAIIGYVRELACSEGGAAEH